MNLGIVNPFSIRYFKLIPKATKCFDADYEYTGICDCPFSFHKDMVSLNDEVQTIMPDKKKYLINSALYTTTSKGCPMPTSNVGVLINQYANIKD